MKAFLVVGFYLTSLFFNLILFILWLRIILRYFHVSILHPFGRLIYQFTNPLLAPLERLIFPPRKGKPQQKYDVVSLAVIMFIDFIKFFILGLLAYQVTLPFATLLILVLANLIIMPCDLLFYALLIRVIMSWVNPAWHNPIADILRMLTDPLLRFGRKLIPEISGFDFSPFVILVILKVITLFISASMPLPLL